MDDPFSSELALSHCPPSGTIHCRSQGWVRCGRSVLMGWAVFLSLMGLGIAPGQGQSVSEGSIAASSAPTSSPNKPQGIPLPTNDAFDFGALHNPNPDPCLEEGIKTDTSICQTEVTPPSLWWIREQFAPQVLENWLAYPVQENQPGRVDLLVNSQIWSLLDYLERYELLNHFGTVNRDYGYNSRVFDNQGNFLAAYTCDFNAGFLATAQLHAQADKALSALSPQELESTLSLEDQSPDRLACRVILDSSGKSSLTGRGTTR